MTGAGSGYIDNGCVLNPFAGIPPLYLHGSFPFIETRSVPLCTVTIQRERKNFIKIYLPPFYPPISPFPTLHAETPHIFSAKFDCRLSVLSRTAYACCRKIFLPDFVGECIFRSLLAWTDRQSYRQKNNQPFGTGLYQTE